LVTPPSGGGHDFRAWHAGCSKDAMGIMMWRTRQGKTPRMGGRITAFLDEESEIEGRYMCSGTVVFDAKFSGEITSRGTLIIGERGVVHANVQAVNLVVRGEVVGDVFASERVELKKTARVIGNIEAPVIVMEEGAVHEGHSRMAKATSVEVEPQPASLSLVVARV
jgi:cytoskeletal protein CcmA (bactofilin family)